MVRILIPALLLLLPLAAQALSLPEAAQLALRNDPRIRAASADVGAAQAAVEQARAGYQPSVSVAADVGRADFQVDSPFPPSGTRTPNSIGAQLTQPLYAGGRIDAQVDAAGFAAEGAGSRDAATRQQVLLAAINAYLSVSRDRAVIGLNQSNLRALDAAGSDTRKRFDAGEATRTDVSQAQARVAGAQAELAGARAALRSSTASFERVVGVAPEALAETAVEPPLPATLDTALQQAQTSPLLREAQAQQRAAQAGIGLARAAGRPQLFIDAQANTADNTDFGYERIDRWSALLKLQLPLYQGGAVSAAVHEAEAREVQAAALAEDTAQAIEESVIQAWESLQAARERVPAFEAQAQAAELALDGVRKELEVGSRTTLDLLDAERELLSAQVSLINSRRDRSAAAYRLLAVTGQLEPSVVR
ncbi:MAG TPA: TolC family outer membrane protein [Solimonas sp.]|nr:TolC family outer membrane protein [Solimonas sp.]